MASTMKKVLGRRRRVVSLVIRHLSRFPPVCLGVRLTFRKERAGTSPHAAMDSLSHCMCAITNGLMIL